MAKAPESGTVIEVQGFAEHGYCKSGSANLYYALFGRGPTKVVMLMGIATSGFAWKNQVEFLVQHPQYQICIFDNRGSGRTITPPGRLTTSLMAQDTRYLMDHLGWDKVHVVGQSLGGMIAQELALVVPDRVLSLSLISTHAGGWRAYVPPWAALFTSIRHPFTRCPKEQARIWMETVFSRKFLSLPGSKEHYSVIKGEYTTVLDFYMESLVGQFDGIFVKENPFYQLWQQVTAVLTHRVTARRLSSLKDKFPILLMVGTGDKIVHPAHTDFLHSTLGGHLVKFDGAGHAVTEECLDQVNSYLHLHICKAL